MTGRAVGSTPRVIVIAGPNGAGKTTFALEFLPREGGIEEFINADLIARGISPLAPERAAVRAGRIMLGLIDHCARQRTSFAFETTLSGMGYVRRIRDWRRNAYHVKLVFLRLPSVELAMARVRSRVLQGGHDVPEPVIRRRFDAGLRNFESIYRQIVNAWVLYDSSGSVPRLLDSGENP